MAIDPIFSPFDQNNVPEWFRRWRNGAAQDGAIDTATVFALRLSQQFTSNSATETFGPNVLIPAGTLRDGDRLTVISAFAKTGTTDSFTATLRLGTAGNATDTTIATATVVATTTRSNGFFTEFRRESATSLQKLGSNNLNGLSSGTSTASPVTVSNLDTTNLLLTFGMVSNGSTDTATMIDMLVRVSRFR